MWLLCNYQIVEYVNQGSLTRDVKTVIKMMDYGWCQQWEETKGLRATAYALDRQRRLLKVALTNLNLIRGWITIYSTCACTLSFLYQTRVLPTSYFWVLFSYICRRTSNKKKNMQYSHETVLWLMNTKTVPSIYYASTDTFIDF